jgi:hypothetical protein
MEVVMKLARCVRDAVVIALMVFGGTSVSPAQQETSQNPRRGSQSEIRFAAPWTPSAVKYSNAQELVVMRCGESAVEGKAVQEPTAYAVARVLMTTRAAVTRMREPLEAIAASRDQPAQFVEIGGWPAVEAKFIESLPRRGVKGEEGAGTLSPEMLVQRAITAIAADDKVVRFDASVLPDAPQGLLNGAQGLARSAHFAKQGNPAEVQASRPMC